MKIDKLLIATRNRGKFPEIITALEGVANEFLSLNDTALPLDYEVEETAASFEGNAILKAVIIANKIGFLTIADDSGLEVDAFDGEPGVYSARWYPGTAEDRVNALLERLRDVPADKRTAKFKVVMAIYNPANERLRTCFGEVYGRITSKPRGAGGFGYDSVFLIDKLNKTFAELSSSEKAEISHRGKALAKARDILIKEFV